MARSDMIIDNITIQSGIYKALHRNELTTFSIFRWIVGPLLSAVFSSILITAWYLMPKWRTLHNYCGAAQVICGTLYQCFYAVSYNDILKLHHTSRYMFLVTQFFSLNATILAYARLVVVYNRTLSYGKRVVTISAFVMAAAVFLTRFISYKIYKNHGVDNNDLFNANHELCVGYILTLKVLLYVKIVKSVMACGKNTVSTRGLNHVAGLVGVAIMCDIVHFIYYVCYTMSRVIIFSNRNQNGRILFMNAFKYMELLLSFRFVPQAMFILLNRSSRYHWKLFVNRRIRRYRAARF